ATLIASTTKVETDLAFVSTQALLRPDGLEILINRDIDNELSTHELRLSSNGSDRLNWTTGLFYRDFLTHGVTDTLLYFPLTGNVNNNTPDSTSTAESWSVYADASYAITDRLELGVGLRYFEEDRGVLNNVQMLSTSGTFDSLTPRVYLSYGVTPDVRLYGSVSQGFRSGGFNSFGIIASGGPATYDPEELTAMEIGAKMSLADGRINAELALYRSNYNEIQSDGFNTEVLSNVTSNIGEAEITGIEWAFNWQPNESFRVGFNGNIIHAEITSLEGASGTSHFVGDPLDYVPRDNYSIIADYFFDWSPTAAGTLRIAFNEQGIMTRTQRASMHFPPQQGYSDMLAFLNIRVGAEWEHWDASLFFDNLLDEDGHNSPGTMNQAATQPRPRTIGVSMGYSFD
ncbi:MAG: TonB-dependent receptor, partial [Woeseia sp.]